MAEMTREEHLAWCKKRAHEYLDRGDIPSAIASMMSDIDKHEETKLKPGPARDMLSMLGIQAAMSGDPREARRYIDGFN
jgi:hypothetical protein